MIQILLNLNRLDQDVFPDADCVVLFDLSVDDWRLFLKSRGRNWDELPGFVESYELNRSYIEEATVDHCNKHGIKLIRFRQEFGWPYLQAIKLKSLLVEFF